MERFENGKYLMITGVNLAISTGVECLCGRSALITLQSSASALQVSSTDNSADVAAGTGARKVRVVGLDANYAIITEDFTMNGQTAVVGTKVFLRVNHVFVLTAGTDGVNAGEIIVSTSGATLSSGVPTVATTVLTSMLAGMNKGTQMLYSVPKGRKYSLVEMHCTNRSQIVNFRLQVRQYPLSLWYMVFNLSLAATAAARRIEFPKGAIIINEKEDFKIDCYAGTNGGVAGFTAIFESEISPQLRM